MKPKYHLLILLVAITGLPALAQNDSTLLARAVSSIKTYSEKYPVEKVYLQLDKPYYAAGDDVWFKAYVTAGSKHELSGISAVLNVELINYKNQIEQPIKLPLVSGLGWGDLRLPDTLREGRYHIRAYTNWMRNAGPEYFFNKVIIIGNAILQRSSNGANAGHTGQQKQQLIKAAPLSRKIDVQFFPESGNLVYGIRSKVAFKATGDDGFGKDITGVIVDEQNHEITKFHSQHLGMGVFNLLPLSGKKYKAIITYADGSENNINLPVPVTRGYVLHVNNTDSLNIEVKIEPSRETIMDSTNTGINLVAQSAGEVYYAAKSKAISSAFTAVIPKSKFPSGIVQFTLFSSDGEPMNERLVFVQNPDQLNLSLSAPGKMFGPREKIKIDMHAASGEGKPALGNFSVAIIDETKVPGNEDTENTILSNLLLTSDLKGYVEKPNYYFTAVNEQVRSDLDLLMLTQGYRRFEWKQVLAGNIPQALYQPERSLSVSGYVKTLSGKPVAHGKVSLLSSSAGFFMLDTLSDEKGHFVFDNLQFKDSTKFVVQSKTIKDKKNIKIELDSTGFAPIMPVKFLAAQNLNIKDNLSVYLANSKTSYDEQLKYGQRNHSVRLNEVKIVAWKTKLENSANLNGPGNADQVLLFKNINTACPSIADCLIGKLRGVFFEYDYLKQCYYAYAYINGIPVRMNIMLDGVIIDAETLSTLPVDIVESVEVLRSSGFTSIYGNDGYHGLLLINAKKGGYRGAASAPNIVTYTPKGYYKAREFYSPQYDDPKTNGQMPDLRTTIYWNPNIVTDKDGKASFEYFNADAKGTYRVIVEGIDGNGKLGSAVYWYTVE